MKHEWRKHEKEYYVPKEKPEIRTIPRFKFFMISGKGDPNGERYSEEIAALYSLSYAIKMLPKNKIIPDGYFDYTVYPLEGIWDLTDSGKQQPGLNKDELVYTIMIRQPDFVTDELFQMVLKSVKKKKPNKYLDSVTFSSMEDGLSVQMMHVGSYDEEPESFALMEKYCMDNNLVIKKDVHHREIYLSDARRVEPSKLKTVLRYMVK